MRSEYTRRRFLVASGLGALGWGMFAGGTPAFAGQSPRAAGPAADPGPAVEALRRLLPNHADQVEFRAGDPAAEGDRFRVSGARGHIVVQGSTPTTMLTGFAWYLKYTANAHFNWAGDQLDLPAELPAPRGEIAREAGVRHRVALNDTNDGYTGPYWDWTRWEHEIDRLATHGYNAVLVTAGQEAVYQRVLTDFGYTNAQARDWFPTPAHQPWWLLQNLCCFNGPPAQESIDQRAELARAIADRLRRLGMTPVLPGYFGTVPKDFAERNAGARVVPQGTWNGFDRPDWLDPRSAIFPRVAESFYTHSAELFGPSSMYKMDLLHEGGNAGDVPVGAATRVVQDALRTARPEAIWAILGWQDNPPTEMVEALDKDRVLILDGLSDRYGDLDREQQWRQTPYAFGTIWNFGGHTTIGANAGVWSEKFAEWRDAADSAVAGIALMPEAADNNPAAYELFGELAWRAEPVDLAAWFRTWSTFRYGAEDTHAAAAWDILRGTAYAMPDDGWSEAHDGLFTARPALDARKAAAWSPERARYDTGEFEKALPELLKVSPALRGTDTYRYDLVDVARQVVSNRSRTLLPRLKAAYEAADRAEFDELAAVWMRHMELLERITATDRRFLLGPWIEQARAHAPSDDPWDRVEYDVRSILSTWGDRQASDPGTLHDYANREWSGLISGFYAVRWRTYLDELSAALAEGREPRAIDWFAMEDAWNRRHDRYPVRPTGDPHEVASSIADELGLAG